MEIEGLILLMMLPQIIQMFQGFGGGGLGQQQQRNPYANITPTIPGTYYTGPVGAGPSGYPVVLGPAPQLPGGIRIGPPPPGR